MNTSTAERVALYARISQDSTGKAVGVADQLEHARTFASARGYRVVAEHSDNDISAFRGKDRPAYQKVLTLARERKIDRVIVFHLTRMTRNRRERAEFIDAFHACKVNVSEAQGGDYDLSTAAGRTWVDIQGALATWESEIKSERITASAARRARSGRPSGDLGYGWTKHGTGAAATWTEHPHEAEVVREIVDRLLAGETLRGITESLNERGERAPKTATWGKTSVKKIAMRESNIAQRIHHRGQPDEERFGGCWPPIVDRAKHEKVVALLTEAGRRSNGIARPGARRHLLSWGIGECGVCGAKLRAVTKRGRHGRPLSLYVCDGKGCVGRSEPSVDEVVKELVIGRMAMPDALDWLRGDDDEARRASERVDELKGRLKTAATAYAADAITIEQLTEITAALQPEITDAERRRDESVVSLDLDALRPLAGPSAREYWDDGMTVSQRRAALELLRLRVIINRTRPGPGFDPDSIQLEWRR